MRSSSESRPGSAPTWGMELSSAPQQEEHLHRWPGPAGGFPRCHPVQGDRDSAHVILREHQLEQTGELLQLHRHLPGEGGTLLQPAAQDLPELAVLLGQRGLPPPAQFLHPLSQPPGQADLLQKAVESHSLSPSCTGRIFRSLSSGAATCRRARSTRSNRAWSSSAMGKP